MEPAATGDDAMNTYTANFSNETITRKSANTYVCAWRVVSRATGKTVDKGFASKPVAESVSYIFRASKHRVTNRGFLVKCTAKEMEAERQQLRERFIFEVVIF
jgi:hypothetical protein